MLWDVNTLVPNFNVQGSPLPILVDQVQSIHENVLFCFVFSLNFFLFYSIVVHSH